ncbi:hypothetical protein ACJQWK_10446 [Exserohilum turcicum]
MFILRTYQLPVVQSRSDGDDNNKEVKNHRPPYCLTAKQKECLELIRFMVDYQHDDSNSDSDSGEDLDEVLEALQDHVLKLILALLDHKLKDNEYESPLVSAMAVLGVSTKSGWLSPLVYTPKQSAIVTVARMLVLYQANRMR